MKKTTTFCRICEAQCGLEVTLENDSVVHIEPDTRHVVSEGYACIKGLTFEKFRASPDRLTHPLKKVGGTYQQISWQQALTEIGSKVRGIRQQHGDDSVGLYFGNPVSFSPLVPLWVAGFVRGLNTSKFFNTGSLDCNNKFAVSERLYGAGMSLTFPDIEKTQFLMVIGGNPAISKMSFINLPHPVARLKAIEERGGRVVFVNPRRTESARALGEQLFIRPDTDVYFLLAFLREVLERDAVDHQRVNDFMEGFDQLWPAVAEWTPEKQSAVTGIEADQLREMVTAYLAADGAALYASTGINQGRNGTLAFWALEVINAITGNLDRRGGSLMGLGILDYGKLMAKSPSETRYSRIGQVPSLLDSFPMPLLPDEILTPGEGQVRALFVASGNPILTSTNSGRLATALESLELMVSVEIFRNETANYADYILPGTHFAERPDIPFSFASLSGLTPRPWFQYTDRLVPPPAECRDETWIFSRLARACDAPLYGSRLFQLLLDGGELAKRIPWLGKRLTPLPERVLGTLCRLTGQGSLRKLRRYPHGRLREPLESNNYLGKRVATPGGKLQLAPPDILALAGERLQGLYAEELAHRDSFKLITKRERFSHNSWTHNDPSYIKGKRNSNYLYIHPGDAARIGVADSGLVRVRSATGELEVPVAFSDDMMQGSVALPHGWGHQRADGLSVAVTTTGVNANILASDGPQGVEPISGMAHFNGIRVDIMPA